MAARGTPGSASGDHLFFDRDHHPLQEDLLGNHSHPIQRMPNLPYPDGDKIIAPGFSAVKKMEGPSIRQSPNSTVPHACHFLGASITRMGFQNYPVFVEVYGHCSSSA